MTGPGCKLCAQTAGDAAGDLLHHHLGGSYVRRVALENAAATVMPSLGPLASGHSIVCPKVHRRSFAECSTDELRSSLALAAEAEWRLRALGGVPVHRFEHGNATGRTEVACSVEHAHLHLLPAAVDPWPRLEALGGWRTLDLAVDSPVALTGGAEYLLYGPPGERQVRIRVGDQDERSPSQLIRQIFADLLNRADRWNWREHPDAGSAHRTFVELSRFDSRHLAA